MLTHTVHCCIQYIRTYVKGMSVHAYYMYVHMYVCRNLHTDLESEYRCMYSVCTYVCTYVRTYCMYVCTYILYVHTYMSMCLRIFSMDSLCTLKLLGNTEISKWSST